MSNNFVLLSENQIIEVFEIFKKLNPAPKSELNYSNPFTLLVAVALSAQTTDKSVAKHVIAMSKMLISDFNSTVPDNREDLEKLPGVGRKTANVVLNVIFNKPTMPVDTHLLRISPKIGLAEGTTPLEVEKSLLERIPPQYLEHAHHWLILHGRYICTARNPKCEECPISHLCAKN